MARHDDALQSPHKPTRLEVSERIESALGPIRTLASDLARMEGIARGAASDTTWTQTIHRGRSLAGRVRHLERAVGELIAVLESVGEMVSRSGV